MRMICPFLIVAAAAAAQEVSDPPQTPLRNVEIVDREGITTRLAGFYRVSGEDLFRGFLGEGEIQVPYERARDFRISAPARPGGRMCAQITLRSGNVVDATFDEREGEQLLSGYAPFGRMTIFFRDIRHLRILGLTSREDLPDYGPPVEGLDVKITDGAGRATELIGFRRSVGENVIPGARGAASIAVPLRIITRLEITEDKESPVLRAAATLRDGSLLDFRLPTYVEETAYRGEAEFGTYRVRLGKVRGIVVHRETPVLRELSPRAVIDRESEAGEPRDR